jgi:hypothetical protein
MSVSLLRRSAACGAELTADRELLGFRSSWSF